MFADCWPTGKSKQRINQVIEVFSMASDISKEYTKKSSSLRNSSVNAKCEPWISYPAKLFVKCKYVEKLF